MTTDYAFAFSPQAFLKSMAPDGGLLEVNRSQCLSCLTPGLVEGFEPLGAGRAVCGSRS